MLFCLNCLLFVSVLNFRLRHCSWDFPECVRLLILLRHTVSVVWWVIILLSRYIFSISNRHTQFLAWGPTETDVQIFTGPSLSHKINMWPVNVFVFMILKPSFITFLIIGNLHLMVLMECQTGWLAATHFHNTRSGHVCKQIEYLWFRIKQQ